MHWCSNPSSAERSANRDYTSGPFTGGRWADSQHQIVQTVRVTKSSRALPVGLQVGASTFKKQFAHLNPPQSTFHQLHWHVLLERPSPRGATALRTLHFILEDATQILVCAVPHENKLGSTDLVQLWHVSTRRQVQFLATMLIIAKNC